ncbi:MAG TPA: hypothetical protein VKR43_01200 [Bryobacteraceae bacterium]|nr:hypothetical protein [Bryobacteraceae bacterium]
MKDMKMYRSVKFALALTLPMVAWADITSTATVNAGSKFSFDTGAVVTSGGDITFTGTSITFVGSAKGAVIPGFSGSANYNQITLSLLQTLASFASASPIPSGSMPVQTIVAVQTNAGNGAKLLITAISSTSISFQFTTFGATGGGGGPAVPTITAVLNNSSLVPSGFPNSGIAPSSLFVIQGNNLSDPGAPSLQDTSKGLPLTLNGASISVTVNGTTVQPAIYYTCGTPCQLTPTTSVPYQIAAVLPAATPVGTGTLTVTYNKTSSAAFTIQVVSSALGINNYSGGLGAITDANGVVYSFTRSATPGALAVIWATGLGADPADSDTFYTTTPHSVNVPLTIYVGGVQTDAAAYQGASVYPGVNQINVKIPASAPNGCYVPVVAVIGNVVSNIVTIPIAAGGGICSEPQYGLRGDQISTLTNQSTVKSGAVGVFQSTSPGAGATPTVNASAIGSFQQVTGSFTSGGGGIVSVGGCILLETITSTTIPTIVGLDAGTITLTGPGASPITLSTIPQVAGLYTATLGAGAIPTSGGTFAFHGTGGAQVGPFDATVNFPNPILNWSNQAAGATVTRSQGLQVTWTGGAPGTYVSIAGSSVSAAGGVSGSFTCIAPQEALQFTVPSYVLLGLPAGTGTTTVTNSSPYTTFTATGLDYGTTYGAVSYSVSSKFN